MDAVPWRHIACWRLGNRSSLVGPTKFRPALLAFDAACSLMLAGVVVAFVEWRRRRRQRFWQFSITEMLAVLAVCGASLGYWRWQHDRHVKVTRLSQQLEEHGLLLFQLGYIGPAWLGRLVGTGALEDFKEPVEATLFRHAGREALGLWVHRDTFRCLRKLQVALDEEVSSGFIDDVSELPKLESLQFSNCRINDRVIARIGAMQSLRELSLFCCQGMSNSALAKLRANARIADLSIDLTPLSTDDSKTDELPHAE